MPASLLPGGTAYYSCQTSNRPPLSDIRGPTAKYTLADLLAPSSSWECALVLILNPSMCCNVAVGNNIVKWYPSADSFLMLNSSSIFL
jgi:hypothetical protein